MRRLSGVLLACAMFLIPAFSHGHGDLFAQNAPPKTTFTGDVAILAYAINPDKTADYDKVIAALKDALSKSEAPEAKQQLAGWKVIKNAMPNPDGTIVYIHIIWFAAWIGFRVEPYPFGLLTMVVSLEAIFLSTFVMISQNRADEKRQVLADHQWQTVQQEEQQNEELLHISNQILELTKAIHAMSTGQSDV